MAMRDSRVYSKESVFDRRISLLRIAAPRGGYVVFLICSSLHNKRGDVRPALWHHPGMQPSVVDLFNKAADLPEEDRATLAGLLIESLEIEIDEGVEQAWQAEVQRRLSE